MGSVGTMKYSINNLPSHPWGKDTATNLLPMASKSDIEESNKIYQTMKNKEYKEVTVNLSELKARQDWIDVEKLKDMYRDLSTPISGTATPYDGGVRVLEYKGNYIVVDGNHRVNTALLKGQKKMKVRILEVK